MFSKTSWKLVSASYSHWQGSSGCSSLLRTKGEHVFAVKAPQLWSTMSKELMTAVFFIQLVFNQIKITLSFLTTDDSCSWKTGQYTGIRVSETHCYNTHRKVYMEK